MDNTKIILTEKGDSSNNPGAFLSSGIATSLFYSSQQDRCCLVLPGYRAKHKFGIHKIFREETAKCISFFADDVTSTTLSNTKIDVVYKNCPSMKKLIVHTKIQINKKEGAKK